MKISRCQWIDPSSTKVLNKIDLIKNMAKKQVVLLGESHDIAEIHRWQLSVANYINAYQPKMLMGFEMFPASKQEILDNWCAGKYKTEEFLQIVEWEKVWGFDKELYLPLFQFCRQNGVPMIGLNCKRDLVTQVGQVGWENIEDKDGLTPAAAALDGYKEFLSKTVGFEVPNRFIASQQTWDRAFACNIKKALDKYGQDYTMIGIIGKGHLEFGFGTPHQLNDLGVTNHAVLITTDKNELKDDEIKNIADAIFRLDIVDEIPVRKSFDPAMMKKKFEEKNSK